MYGISMREANAICRDHNGFIWASSKMGILRLTDDDYRIYQLPYETAHVISVRLAYRDSSLLVYTNNGQLFVYNEVLDRFERLINLSKILDNIFISINSVHIGSDKTLWLGTSFGLYHYRNNQLELIEGESSTINLMEAYSNREMIVAKENLLFLFDTQTRQSTPFETEKLLPGSTISALFMDHKRNCLWIGTLSEGLYVYNFSDKQMKKLPIDPFPDQPVLSLEMNDDSTLLAGIDGQGVWQVNLNEFRVLNVYKEDVNDPGSLRGNGVYDIMRDEHNRIWVCTYSGGVSFFDQASPFVDQITHQINNSNSLVNNDVNCVLQDHKGRIWLATNNGISCWDRGKNHWKSFYTNKQTQAQVFLALCEDDRGRIWAGTYSSGIYIMNSETGDELHHYSSKVPDSPIKNDYIFDLYKDREGNIWIGGINAEVICYKIREDQFQRFSVQPLYVFAEYPRDKMLMGCTYGLSITEKANNTTQILIDGFLVEDLWVSDSIVWICTSGEGLIRFNPATGSKLQYTTNTGMSSNFINSIIEVDESIWLGTEKGLCRFSPETGSVVTYSSIQHLSNFSFNRNAVCLLSDGQLAWGSNNGLVLFHPEALRETEHQGKIFIQDLSISGRSIRDIPSLKLEQPVDKLERIKLKYNQNTITLELLPIGAVPGSKFSWKLEGLEENWSAPSNNRIVTFSNIPGKDYRLNIRLYDSSLSNLIDERALFINITPPFWGTWYFFILIFIFITALIYMVLWYYINALKQQHTEEKVRFFTNTAHDIRTSLTLIKAPVEELSKDKALTGSSQYYLSLAKEQVTRLSSVITQLMDFQKVDVGRGQLLLKNMDVVPLIENRVLMFVSLASGKQVRLLFLTDRKSFLTAVDESKIEKIVDNLVSNAIKYSHPGGEVRISLKFSDSKWYLVVSDQGIGICKKEQRQLFREFYRGENAINTKIVGSGIGLLLVRNYITMMGGNIACTSQENVGSTFEVALPVKSVPEPVKEKRLDHSVPSERSGYDKNDMPERKDEENRLGSMSILIVEDNDDLRNFIQHALSSDFEVQVADNGATAWEIIRKDIPDLIVSDIMMPELDGFELCRLMKSTFETSHIPIILLTALSGKADQLQGLGLGADDYLTKPFDIALLKQKIITIIRNRESVRERAIKLIKAPDKGSILINEHNDQFLKNMLQVVHKHLSDSEFSKEDFAVEMNVSTSLLYKKIKSLTGQSPTDFIKTVRLDYALELLQSGNYSVTEVSEISGFSSVGYFSTVFKKHFGKPPTGIIDQSGSGEC